MLSRNTTFGITKRYRGKSVHTRMVMKCQDCRMMRDQNAYNIMRQRIGSRPIDGKYLSQ